MTEQKDNKTKKTSIESYLAPDKPGSFKFYFIQFIAVFIVAMIIWPVFDIAYSTAHHTEFIYTADAYVLQPLIFAVIFAILSYLIDLIRFKIKKSKK